MRTIRIVSSSGRVHVIYHGAVMVLYDKVMVTLLNDYSCIMVSSWFVNNIMALFRAHAACNAILIYFLQCITLNKMLLWLSLKYIVQKLGTFC